jgi:hypothetical protein
MANYRAIANGNWSNLAIWQDDSLGYFANSTVLPTSIDDVYANNFTVTIDGTRNANTIRNTAFTPPTFLGAMSIPQMTSNTTPSGTAAASGASSPAWRAFDRDTGSSWQSPNAAGQWLSYQFPTGRIIKRYGFFTSSTVSFNPRTWTFEGSNDGSTWVVLDTQTNFVTGVSTFHSFDISANTTSYTYYRINVTAVQGGGTNPTAIVELEMSEITNLYGGTVAGGFFTFANGGNLTCTSTQALYLGSATVPTLQMTLPSGNTGTFTGDVLTMNNLQNSVAIRLSNTGTLNLIGNYNADGSTSNSLGNKILISSTNGGILNIVGNLDNTAVRGGSQSTQTLSIIGGQLNITGDVNNNSSGISGGANNTIAPTSCVVNITGNVNTNNRSSTIITGGELNIIGNILTISDFASINNVTIPTTFNIIGTTTSGNASPAIQGLITTFVKVRGNVINTDTYAAIYAGRVVIDDNVTSWQFKDSTNTVTRTLYAPGVALGNPATSNVRNGVTYGPSLELTGTAFIPTADNVRKGVPVDATIGTADLTAADMWDYLASNITTSGSIGEVVKNIKTKTDLIPNNPTSNESVGAIVASYNI